jgi:hypothetical protein
MEKYDQIACVASVLRILSALSIIERNSLFRRPDDVGPSRFVWTPPPHHPGSRLAVRTGHETSMTHLQPGGAVKVRRSRFSVSGRPFGRCQDRASSPVRSAAPRRRARPSDSRRTRETNAAAPLSRCMTAKSPSNGIQPGRPCSSSPHTVGCPLEHAVF